MTNKRDLARIEKAKNKAFEDAFNKSVKALRKNSKDMEKAIKQVLSADDLKVSEEEFTEIQKLTKTLNEIDSIVDRLE